MRHHLATTALLLLTGSSLLAQAPLPLTPDDVSTNISPHIPGDTYSLDFIAAQPQPPLNPDGIRVHYGQYFSTDIGLHQNAFHPFDCVQTAPLSTNVIVTNLPSTLPVWVSYCFYNIDTNAVSTNIAVIGGQRGYVTNYIREGAWSWPVLFEPVTMKPYVIIDSQDNLAIVMVRGGSGTVWACFCGNTPSTTNFINAYYGYDDPTGAPYPLYFEQPLTNQMFFKVVQIK